MTTYNPTEPVFRRQVNSIRSQSFDNWICIVQDDWSSYAGLQAIRRVLGDDPRFILHRNERNLGFYSNFEHVLGNVPPDCDLVCLADQDDCWYPDKLSRLIAGFTTADTTLVYSDMRIVDTHGNVVSDTFWSTRRNNYTDIETLFFANTISGAAAMFKAALLPRLLPFPPKRGLIYHDWWIGLVALASGRLNYIDEPLYDYYQHAGNVVGWSHIGRIVSLRQFLRSDPYRRELAQVARTMYNYDCKFLAATIQTLRLRVPESDHHVAIDRLAKLTQHPVRTMAGQVARSLLLQRAARTGRKTSSWPTPSCACSTATSPAASARSSRNSPRPKKPPSISPARRPLVQARWQARAGGEGAGGGDASACPSTLSNANASPSHSICGPASPAHQHVPRHHRLQVFLRRLCGHVPARQTHRQLRLQSPLHPRRANRFPARPLAAADPALRRPGGHLRPGRGRIPLRPLHSPDGKPGRPLHRHKLLDRLAGRRRRPPAWPAPFVFMIQEYEPYFVAHGSYYALSHAAYDLHLYGVFSTELLREFFRKNRFGIYRHGPNAGDERSIAFHNAILKFDITEARLRQRQQQASSNAGSTKRKFLFYCRPEAHAQRNMFELGILALRRAISHGTINPRHWEFYGIGTVGDPFVVPLPGGAELSALPKMSLEEYASYLPDFDLGMSLMYTPHPSLVPLEMTSAGLIAVTNTYANKTADALRHISSNFEVGAATIEDLADALARAAARVDDFAGRGAGSRVNWPTSWDQAFAPDVIQPLINELANARHPRTTQRTEAALKDQAATVNQR